jgi:hypothetical protein
MTQYRTYGKLDDQPVVDGDRAFLGFGSFRDAASVPENYLSESENLRLENNTATVRKGLKRLTSDSTVLGATVLASTFYRDPNGGTEYVVLACSDRAYFVNPADGSKKTILYSGGQTAAAGCSIMQAFHSLYLWRTASPSLPFTLSATLGEYPLIFDGEGLSAETGTFDKPAETSTIPPATFAVYASNRLCVGVGRDQIRFSMILDPGTFQEQDRVEIDPGNSDSIQSLTGLDGAALLVGKRRGLHVLTSINDLEGNDYVQSEVTRQFGVVARNTVKQVGGLLFLLSDSGVYSVNVGVRGTSKVGTPLAYLQITDDPISADIEDVIDTINFTVAAGEVSNIAPACATVADNRFFLAVPTSNADHDAAGKSNDRILVYNIVLNSWESVDTLPSGVYVNDLVRIIYNDRLRVAAVCDSGKILLLDENETGTDEYGNGVSASTTAVDAKAVTRLYRGKTTSLTSVGNEWKNLKRFKSVQIGSSSKTTSSTKIRILAQTREPDSGPTELDEFTTTAVEEDLRRLGVRKRGNGIQITIDNGSTPAGRWELRDISIEAHEGSRQRRNYS